MITMSNEPAFPVVTPNGNMHIGITKLDYFAAACLQGFLARSTMDLGHNPAAIADACYNVAEAMIAEERKRAAKGA
ncbi:MAG: hypothetical protein QM703_15760 [Gemmatales bacterium]